MQPHKGYNRNLANNRKYTLLQKFKQHLKTHQMPKLAVWLTELEANARLGNRREKLKDGFIKLKQSTKL